METEALRRMSAAQKLAVMTSLIQETYRLKGAWVRVSESELSEEELRRRVLEAVAGDRA
jgi:oligoribonuclease (3'-5' exoribonuclease)